MALLAAPKRLFIRFLTLVLALCAYTITVLRREDTLLTVPRKT